MIISSAILLEMRNVSDKIVEKMKAHILCSITFFFENYAFYEAIWKDIVERDRPHMKIRRMRIACYITKGYKHTLRLCND